MVDCPACTGTGYDSEEDVCWLCEGRGVVTQAASDQYWYDDALFWEAQQRLMNELMDKDD